MLAVIGALSTLFFTHDKIIKVLRWVGSNFAAGLGDVHPKLRGHALFAKREFDRLNKVLYRNMLLQGVGLADQQDLMVDELSLPIQKTVTMLVTAFHASEKGDEATIAAANILCHDLTRELNVPRKDAKYRRAARRLADMVLDGKFEQIKDTPAPTILRQYK